MPGDFWIAILSGALVVPVLFWFGKQGKEPSPSTLWARAWGLLWLGGALLALAETSPILQSLGALSWILGSALMLAGIRAFTGNPARRPLGAAVVGLALVAALAQFVLPVGWKGSIPSAISASMLGWAALSMTLYGRRPGARPAEQALGPALGLMALFDAIDWLERLYPGSVGSVFTLWLIVAVATAFLQLIVVGDRDTERVHRLTEEREVLRRIALALGHDDFASEFVDALRGTRYRDLFMGFGVWVKPGPDNEIEYVAGNVRGGLPRQLRQTTLDRPILRAALESDGPLFLDDMREDDRIIDPIRRSGLERGFIAPLRIDEDLIGLIGGTLEVGRELDADTRSFVADLADQIALVMAATRLRKAQALDRARIDADRRMLREMTEAVLVGVLLTDPEGRIQLISRRMCEVLGLSGPETWQDRPGMDAFREACRGLVETERDDFDASIAEWGRSPGAAVPATELECTDGRTIVLAARPVVSGDGDDLGRVWIAQDVSEERALAAQLQQSDRMQTMGTLAGGLAHDFNNQLTAILGNASLIEETLEPGGEAAERIHDLVLAAEHCAELTQGLLDFASRKPVAPRPVSVAAVIRSVEGMIRPAMPQDVAFEVDIASDAGFVHADEMQLRRVLTNLLVNARDAVGAHGRIRLRADRPSGSSVRFRVEDDGAGMDEATARQIFEPFFTSKPDGRGTGLGLAVVHGIVTSHGAQIDVETQPERGSTFSLTWPGAPQEEADPAKARTRIAPGKGVVLLAEDQSAVRNVIRSALEAAGFEVIETANGRDAVDLARAHEIDFALLDLSMPGLDGLQALERIRALQPDLPFLVMSGHPERAGFPEWPSGIPLLLKPFTPDAVVERVIDLAREKGAD